MPAAYPHESLFRWLDRAIGQSLIDNLFGSELNPIRRPIDQVRDFGMRNIGFKK